MGTAHSRACASGTTGAPVDCISTWRPSIAPTRLQEPGAFPADAYARTKAAADQGLVAPPEDAAEVCIVVDVLR
jgi:hypothetical protein